VRFDDGPDAFRISMVAVGQVGPELNGFDGTGEIRPLDDTGASLIKQYLAFESAVDDTGKAPPSVFAPGPYTTGLVKTFNTFAPHDPHLADTTTGGLDTNHPSFEVVAGDTRLYCGYVAWTETVSAADGSPVGPDALGDYGHLVDAGLYHSFVVQSSEEPCMAATAASEVTVLSWDWNRTTVRAVK
jgi:hypothetical protein